jgi:hypothetical protein
VDELDAAPAPSPAAVAMADEVTCGLAIHNARNLQSLALGLRLAGADDNRCPQSTALARQASLTVERRGNCADFAVPESGVAQAILRVVEGEVPADWFDDEGALDGGAMTRHFATPLDAWRALEALPPEATVALDYRFLDANGSDSAALARIDAMASLSEQGQALATESFAFALLCRHAAIQVETLGDIRSPHGIFPLYALTRRGQDRS